MKKVIFKRKSKDCPYSIKKQFLHLGLFLKKSFQIINSINGSCERILLFLDIFNGVSTEIFKSSQILNTKKQYVNSYISIVEVGIERTNPRQDPKGKK
jgi:hypothetical protein